MRNCGNPRVIRQERGAWEGLVHRYGHHIYALCVRVCEAEDLEATYLTMFTVLREEHFVVLRAFDGRATLTTYLTLVLGHCLAGQRLGMRNTGLPPSRLRRLPAA